MLTWTRVRTALVKATAIAVACIFLSHAFAQSCAMCATALTDPNDPLTKAFNWSIILLISAPYLLGGTVASWFAYSYWRAQRSRPPLQVLRFAPNQKENVQ